LVVVQHPAGEERNHAVADGEEDRQQQKPHPGLEGKHREQGVAGHQPEQVGEHAEPARAEGDAGDSGVQLVGVAGGDQHVEQRIKSDPPAGEHQHQSDNQQPFSGQQADIEQQHAARQQQKGRHIAARRHLGAVHPVGIDGHQKAEDEKWEEAVNHQEAMCPDGRDRPCGRQEHRDIAPEQLGHPPHHDGQTLNGTAEKHHAMGRGGERSPDGIHLRHVSPDPEKRNL
jgi:hypothetical protein